MVEFQGIRQKGVIKLSAFTEREQDNLANKTGSAFGLLVLATEADGENSRTFGGVMIRAAIIALLTIATAADAQRRPLTNNAWDVAAVEYTTPPSHPCNKPLGGSNGWSYAVCITGDETHWKCADNRRILLASEDGTRHCILFPPREEEIVIVRIPER